MSEPRRVVFDCNVFLQALARPRGPSGACVSLAIEQKVTLFLSHHVLNEIRDVIARPELVRKFKLRPERVSRLLEVLPRIAVLLSDIPPVWTYERDLDDAHYVNLGLEQVKPAVACVRSAASSCWRQRG